MNKKQMIAMWIGVAVFVYFTFTTCPHVEGYWAGMASSLNFPLPVLLLDCIVVSVAAIYTLKDKKK